MLKYPNRMMYLIIIFSVSLFSCSQSDVTEKEIDKLISEMTLEEKVNMIHASSSFTSGGVERLGIPELKMSDGPHGVRMEHGRDWTPDDVTTDSATYLPTGITLASTWNKKLGYEYGQVLGSEANERGKDVILGPGVNILRSPLAGRNFEYLSEDPYLSSVMGVGYIKGVQSFDVGACVKHYVANNQETNRAHINVILSERALREIYLPAFKAAVQDADVATVMSAYNKVNGTFCSEDEYVLDEILRKEYGFDQLVVSDWGAVHSTENTLLYGADIEMGTELQMSPRDYSKFFLADSAVAMVKSGRVKESFVDAKVRRILRTMFKLKMFSERVEGKRNTAQHQETALKVAEEGIVLLKNEEVLPVSNKVKTIAVIGDNATAKHAHLGGSSQVKALYEVTALEGIKNLVEGEYKILHARGYEPNEENKLNKKLLIEAVQVARKADLVIFVGGWIHGFEGAPWGEGTFDAEALDKVNLDPLFGQEKLISEIHKVNKNIVSVIYGGSQFKFGDWSAKSKAILHVWYPGMEGGNAIANILFGKTNPSGKLPVSFANDYKDYPDHVLGEYPGDDVKVEYKDDIFVGYRYFDTFNKPVNYPFGFGLSYTTFDITNINIDKTEFNINDELTVSVEVENTGELSGAEVVQLYVRDVESSLTRPLKELKGFEKVFLESGEKQVVKFNLAKQSFSFYNPEIKDWQAESGQFEILIGNSSANILQKTVVTLK